MIGTMMCVSMLFIAASQCFHVFKNYRTIKMIQMEIDSILHLLMQYKRELNAKEEKVIIEEKKPGSNRKPRTDAQKALASQQKKEYWAKRRASEAKSTEAPKT